MKMLGSDHWFAPLLSFIFAASYTSTTFAAPCPNLAWGGGTRIEFAKWNFGTDIENVIAKKAWSVSGTKSAVTLSEGDEKVTSRGAKFLADKDASLTLDMARAGVPLDHRGALEFEMDWSELTLEATESDFLSKGFEIARIDASGDGYQGTKRHALMIVYKTSTGGKARIGYQTDQYVYVAGDINLSGSHRYVLGFDDKLVYLCQDDDLVVEARRDDAYDLREVQKVELGRIRGGDSSVQGSYRVKSLAFTVPALETIVVDPIRGRLTFREMDDRGLKSITVAAQVARPGTTISLKSGKHRGAIALRSSGRDKSPIKISGVEGQSAVQSVVLGSLNAGELQWKLHSGEIYYADIPSDGSTLGTPGWGLTSIINRMCRIASDGVCRKVYHLARTPNFFVKGNDKNAYKHMQYWNTADGGGKLPPSSCDPRVTHDECDEESWSLNEIIDVNRYNDNLHGGRPVPLPGIIPSQSLKEIGDMRGGKITISDGQTGFYCKTFEVQSHNRDTGKIKIPEDFSSGGAKGAVAAIRPFAKYFVSDKLHLLDSAGEFYFDKETRRLYVWRFSGDDWSNLEISGDAEATAVGLELTGKSYIEMTNVALSLFHDACVRDQGTESDIGADNIIIQDSILHGALNGIEIRRIMNEDPAMVNTYNWLIKGNEISGMAMRFIMSLPFYKRGKRGRDPTTAQSAISKFVITENVMIDGGFFEYHGIEIGLVVLYATDFTVTFNHIEKTAGEGLRVESGDNGDPAATYPSEIRNTPHGTNVNSLVAWNFVNRACELKADCGAFLTFGSPPFDVFAYENIIANTFGFTGPTSQMGETAGGGISLVNGHGYGGIFFRNVIFNHMVKGFHITASDDVDSARLVFENNHIARARECIRLVFGEGKPGVAEYSIKNNVVTDCLLAGFTMNPQPKRQLEPRSAFSVDSNYYYDVKRDKESSGAYQFRVRSPAFNYDTLEEIRDAKDTDMAEWFDSEWEVNGKDGDLVKEMTQRYQSLKLPAFTSVNDRTIRPVDLSLFSPSKNKPSSQEYPRTTSVHAAIEAQLRYWKICVPTSDENSIPAGALSEDNARKCFKGIGTLDDPRLEKKRTILDAKAAAEFVEEADSEVSWYDPSGCSSRLVRPTLFAVGLVWLLWY